MSLQCIKRGKLQVEFQVAENEGCTRIQPMTITSSPQLITPPDNSQRTVLLTNRSSAPIYISHREDVTPGSGELIPPKSRIRRMVPAFAALFAVSTVLTELRVEAAGGDSMQTVSGAVTATNGGAYLFGAPGVLTIPADAKAGFSTIIENGADGSVKWALPANWTNQYEGGPQALGKPLLSYRGAVVCLTVISPGTVQVSTFNAGYAVPGSNGFHIGSDIPALQMLCHAGFGHNWSNAGNPSDATAFPRTQALRWGHRWGQAGGGLLYSPVFSADPVTFCPVREIDSVTGRDILNFRDLGGPLRGLAAKLIPTTPNFTVGIALRNKATGIDGQILTTSTRAVTAVPGTVEGLRYGNGTIGYQGLMANMTNYAAWSGAPANAFTETTNPYFLWAEWNNNKFNAWINGTQVTTEHASSPVFLTPTQMVLRGNSSLSPSIIGYLQIDGVLSPTDRTKAMAHGLALFIP